MAKTRIAHKTIHLIDIILLLKQMFLPHSLQRCSTMLGGGMPVTASLSDSPQFLSSPASSSFPSGTLKTPFPQTITVALNLCILCCRIIYCTWVYPVTIYEPFFGYYFFNGLLMVLQCLHIFWAVLIIRIAVRFLTSNVRNWRLNPKPSPQFP